MPTFSSKSYGELETCHESLLELFSEVIKHYDCTILEGSRSPERQLEMFREGKSKVKHGKHNHTPSLAVDVAPYPIEWDNMSRFYHFAGFVLATATQLDIKVRWGGDWDSDGDFSDQTFNDLVHWELVL